MHSNGFIPAIMRLGDDLLSHITSETPYDTLLELLDVPRKTAIGSFKEYQMGYDYAMSS